MFVESVIGCREGIQHRDVSVLTTYCLPSPLPVFKEKKEDERRRKKKMVMKRTEERGGEKKFVFSCLLCAAEEIRSRLVVCVCFSMFGVIVCRIFVSYPVGNLLPNGLN